MIRPFLSLLLALPACSGGKEDPDMGGIQETAEPGEPNDSGADDTDTPGDDTGEPADVDADGDGFFAEADCDDTDASVFPGAAEACDGVDNNCDGAVDEGVTQTAYPDADGDGFGDEAASTEVCEPAAGFVLVGGDCDDTEATTAPGATETCDGVDNNCDSTIDEGLILGFWLDADLDGYGDDATYVESCEAPAGYTERAGDCDDADPAYNPGAVEADCTDPNDYNCDGSVGYADADADGWAACADCDDSASDIRPDGLEVCGGADEDCDGLTDEADPSLDPATTLLVYTDADADGYGDDSAPLAVCTLPAGASLTGGDCDDADASTSPGDVETCDGVDNNCDSLTDDADPALDLSSATTWYRDADNDTFGDPAVSTQACLRPSGYRVNKRDCDDTNARVNPSASEVCDAVDNDCDSLSDDADPSLDAATATTWYDDDDGDLYGDPSSATVACSAPSGALASAGDCDDADAATYPGASEPCSAGVDRDCDGAVPDTCQSCAEVLADGLSTGDGLYTLDVDGAAGSLAALSLYCDMTTDGGGFTLVQRTVWDWADSSQLLTNYADWHGTLIGDPSPGAAFRLPGAAWEALNVEAEHLLVHTPRDLTTGADCDPLRYLGESGEYTITTLGAALTPITSSALFTNSQSLSTTDTGPSTTCVNTYGAVPWFYSSCCTTCPTFKGSYWSDSPHPMASYLDYIADLDGNTTAICPSGAAVSSYGYEGVNAMEYYLR
jgi:hypothetical protein